MASKQFLECEFPGDSEDCKAHGKQNNMSPGLGGRHQKDPSRRVNLSGVTMLWHQSIRTAFYQLLPSGSSQCAQDFPSFRTQSPVTREPPEPWAIQHSVRSKPGGNSWPPWQLGDLEEHLSVCISISRKLRLAKCSLHFQDPGIPSVPGISDVDVVYSRKSFLASQIVIPWS